ncbi:MAG: glycosyltransferase family 4 protein [Acidobacteria bacterium]|nr:glycosyltransferase family 4 protein [Acidobacteriota bacterium]
MRALRIGIDGGCWNNRRGYGRFLREILAPLPALDAGASYTLFLDSSGVQDQPVPPGVRVVEVSTSAGVNQAAHASGRRSLPDLLRMSLTVARHDLDLFFFPSVYSYFPLLRPVPTLLCIHDTIPERNPAFAFHSARQRRFWNWKVRLALAQARRVLTVSQYSRRCIERHLGWPADRTDVIYEAASSAFRPVPVSGGQAPYVLHVGGISPNKNLPALVRAFASVQQSRPGIRLVLAGDHLTDGFKSSHAELAALIRAAGLESSVSFTGYVPEHELPALYSGAALLAFPSLDEGFGLPAVEAMSCGLPVVASRGHALEEVVGGAGLLVDPGNEEQLALAIAAILDDPARATRLRQQSLARAAEFSWSRAAGELLAVFRGMMERL